MQFLDSTYLNHKADTLIKGYLTLYCLDDSTTPMYRYKKYAVEGSTYKQFTDVQWQNSNTWALMGKQYGNNNYELVWLDLDMSLIEFDYFLQATGLGFMQPTLQGWKIKLYDDIFLLPHHPTEEQHTTTMINSWMTEVKQMIKESIIIA